MTMRILLVSVYWSTGGGIQSHTRNLREWLLGHGHEVYVAGSAKDVPADDIDVIELPLDRCTGAEGGDGNSNILTRVYWMFYSAVRLRRAIRGTRVDIVHAHETTPLIVGWLATIGLRMPTILTFHGASPERRRSFAWISRLFADCVVSPSETSVDQLADTGVPRDRIVQLGLGVPQFGPVDRERVAELRSASLGEDGEFLVLSLSRLDAQKALDAMIRVASEVRKRVPGIRFVVAGDGPLRSQLERQIEEYGVGDIFALIGKTHLVAEYLSASDIYLLTSLWEELPISIVEAQRSGLPVVATDSGGVREVVDDSVGRLCDVGDEACIAKALIDICTDEEMRARMGRNAVARSQEERFSVEAVNAKYERLYLKLRGS